MDEKEITLADENYAMLNDGADAWWDAYGDEAMEILETIELGY